LLIIHFESQHALIMLLSVILFSINLKSIFFILSPKSMESQKYDNLDSDNFYTAIKLLPFNPNLLDNVTNKIDIVL